jgi:hypothetical protein
MKGLFVLLVALAIPALADEAQLVTPQLAKPATEAAAGDALHEKYEAAWFRYEKAIAEVRGKVNAALDTQFEKAADAGNLDLADMWDKKKKFFADTGSVAWPSDGKTKTEWRKKHPTTDFPDEFSEAVATAKQAYDGAVDALKSDYEALIKEYTKARNIERAMRVKEEMAALSRNPPATPARPKMVEEKPVAKAQHTPGDHVARRFLDKMMTAVEKNDYDRFVADTSASYKATLTKEIVAKISEQLAPRMKKGYDVLFLGHWQRRGHTSYIWKVTFNDGGDELAVTLSLKDGEVGGSLWQF